MSCGNGLPLVAVDTDAVHTSILGGFFQSAITGLATGAEDNICAILEGLSSGGSTPLGVGEGDIQTTGVVSGDNADIGIDVASTGFITFLKGHHGGDQVSTENGSN